MQSQTPTLSGKAAVMAGLRARCPNCGQGRLFAGWMKVAARCETCGFELAKVETGDGAATFIMQLTGICVGMPALAFNIIHQPPLWLNLLIWPPLVILMAVGLMRPGKGLMTALNLLRMRGR